MTKLRVPGAALAAGSLVLPRDTAKYVVRVHRLRVDDAFVMFDPEARTEADATILSTENEVSVRLGSPRPSTRVPSRRAVLVQCIGKADKIDQFLLLMEPLGLVECSRTGIAAIARGPESM